MIHDAWFEYRTRNGVDEQIYKAGWTEQAIALTSSIVTGIHGHGQRTNAGREHARLTFSVRQERGSAPTVAINLVDGEIPSLGRGQLSFTLPDGTDFEGARRIARYLNRDVVALTIQRNHASRA